MLGEIIGAAGSLLGGLFGKKSTEKANDQNVKLQREFAQNGIQWKVADAKAAGVHPLAALGAQTTSFSPSIVGDTSLSSGISNMGQDIGRAVSASSSSNQRKEALGNQILELQLQSLKLDNQGKFIGNSMLASQAARQAQVGPPFPSASGSTNTGIPGQAMAPVGRSDLQLGGIPIYNDPSITNAGAAEDVMGEPGDWLFGGAKIVSAIRQALTDPKTRQAWLNAAPQHGPMNYGPQRKYRPPGNYGPRVTTPSFRNTFQ